MVRLVLRPYTQVWRTICTSVPLRASIRVSPDFTLLKHSSPSFGSEPICYNSNLSQKIEVGRMCRTKKSILLLSLRVQVWHSHTRIWVRLLGPCFKTGRIKPFRQRREVRILQLIATNGFALESPQTFRHDYAALKRTRIPKSGWGSGTLAARPTRKHNFRTLSPNTQFTLTPTLEKHHWPKPATISNLETGFIRFLLSVFRHF